MNHIMQKLDALIESTMDPASIQARREKIAIKIAAEKQERESQKTLFTECCHEAMAHIIGGLRYPNTGARRAILEAMRHLRMANIAANKINPEDD